MNDIERLGVAPLLLAKVGDLSPDYPAVLAGLRRGDQIIAINDSPVNSWTDMTDIIYNNPEKPLQFTILRNNETFPVEIIPKASPVNPENEAEGYRGIIGIGPYTEHHEVAFFPAIAKGFERALFLGQLNIKGFGRIISGKDSARESLAGPIAIAKMAGDIARQGIVNLIELIAYLSVVLALINILPIPALDGGHLVIILIEGIRQKPLPLRAKMIVQQIGMLFLLLLIIFVSYNDITR
jgi:regulator of sigma E protease